MWPCSSARLAMRPVEHRPQGPCSQGASNMKTGIEYSYSLPTHYDCCPTFNASGVRRKFSWGVSFSGRWWSFVFGVCCLWRHNLTSYSCSQAKFVDIIGIFFYPHSPYFCKKASLIHSPCNKFFAKYQAQGVGFNPNPSPPCVRPCSM